MFRRIKTIFVKHSKVVAIVEKVLVLRIRTVFKDSVKEQEELEKEDATFLG